MKIYVISEKYFDEDGDVYFSLLRAHQKEEDAEADVLQLTLSNKGMPYSFGYEDIELD